MNRLVTAIIVWLFAEAAFRPSVAAETFRVATFNLDAYLVMEPSNRKAKSEESKRKIHEFILAIRPDVIALQEVGGPGALLELQSSLSAAGLELPHSELVSGVDTNLHVAILSRFPLTARRPQTNDFFLAGKRRFKVSRGLGEVDVRVNEQYGFTLLTAHLKSKRPVAMADEAELRYQEAKVLRERIDRLLKANPQANIVVLGDLNDVPAARSTRIVLGRGQTALIDTRPMARDITQLMSGAPQRGSGGEMEDESGWTYYFTTEKSYSRIDYLLLSNGMAHEWVTNESYVMASPDWRLASDHRPVVATFRAEEGG